MSTNSNDMICTGRRKAAASIYKKRNNTSLGECLFLWRFDFYTNRQLLIGQEEFWVTICFLISFLQDFSYKRGDYLLFGSETTGLPPEALEDCKNQPFGGGTLRIPMVETYVRCLNLSVSVGIAIYEASRQLNYEQLQVSSESCTNNEQSIITEDVFAWSLDVKFCTILILFGDSQRNIVYLMILKPIHCMMLLCYYFVILCNVYLDFTLL